MVVEVANGHKLTTSQLCPQLKWKMQVLEFVTNLLILPAGGCELVLGMQWLCILGDVKWNFSELKMEFMQRGRRVILRGSKQAPIQLL